MSLEFPVVPLRSLSFALIFQFKTTIDRQVHFLGENPPRFHLSSKIPLRLLPAQFDQSTNAVRRFVSVAETI